MPGWRMTSACVSPSPPASRPWRTWPRSKLRASAIAKDIYAWRDAGFTLD